MNLNQRLKMVLGAARTQRAEKTAATLKHQLNVLLGRAAQLSPVQDVPAPFDLPAALEQTRSFPDPFIRAHALDLMEKGFCVVTNSVDDQLVNKARDAFFEWKERNAQQFLPDFFRENGRLDRVVNLHAALPEFRDLFVRNRALAVQDYLFQQETILYTSLFFEVGSTQALHRDTPLFWTKPANHYFGMWVALEGADSDNGPLRVVPGSHRLPLLDRNAIARQKYADVENVKPIDNDLWLIYQEQIGRLCAEHGLVEQEVHVEQGDTVIWHPLLVHGGAMIRNLARTRLSLVIHTTPKGVPVFHNDVFFNVSKAVTDLAPWSYTDIGGRFMMRAHSVSIGHAHDDFDFSKLR